MAQHEDFTIDQGADAAIELHLTDKFGATKNLTGYSVLSKMKKSLASDSADTINFTAIISDPPSDGILTLSLNNLETDNIKAGRYLYDTEISFVDSDANTIIERVLEGSIIVTPSVTR